MGNIKSWLTDIVAVLATIFAAVQAYLGTIGEGSIDWFQFAIVVVTAVIAFFTGRNPDASKKKNPTNV